MREKQANRRLRLLGVFFALVFAGVLARAVWIQGVKASHYAAIAKKEHHQVVTTPATRGTIFDRTGVPLAIGEQMTTIFADPAQVQNPAGIAKAARTILGVSPKTLYPELLDKRSQFTYIKRFIDASTAERFLKKGFAGVYTEHEEKRVYPELSVGSQVIGFAGTQDTGLTGLELEYNKQLSGKPGKETVVADPFGRPIDLISSTTGQPGEDVFSTIDHTMQAKAEAVLRQTIEQWDAKSAQAIVLDPRTGAVLTMAQVPGYDANDTSNLPTSLELNHAVTDTYEPGSTFKLVTITAALTKHVVTPSTRFTLPYELRYGTCVVCTVHDAEPRPTETLSVAQILSHSSNVGVVTIAKLLGPATIMQWVQRFGFGKPTGIDFPGESAGMYLPLDEWNASTIGNVPIGQGISVTPIQMASVYAAVANGGVWIQPHLVDRVGGHTLGGWKERRLISPAIDATVKKMLLGVVDDEGGTGTEAQIPGYSVAGKTGTAQVSDGPAGYSKYDFTATFVGMVPASKPRLVILVKVDDPRNSIYGGVVAAPAFTQIAKFDLQYLEIPPDEPRTLASASSTSAP